MNEIFRFQASTYYTDNIDDFELQYLKKIDGKQQADVIFSDEDNVAEFHDGYFVVSSKNQSLDGYGQPVFTWQDENFILYVYVKQVQDLQVVKSWDELADLFETPVCVVGNGAVSFRKTFLKEYPERKNIWASDNEHYLLPITQHKDGVAGMWVEEKVQSRPSVTRYDGGYYLKFQKPGILDSAQWVYETPKKSHTVTCAALNFRDVMRAFGKLKERDMNVGFEFSGYDNISNKRVCGVGMKCIGTHCTPAYTYPIPSYLTDAEAATVPVVYLTAYYSLFEKARVRPGNTVLVHAGSGGVGQATIQICQSRNIQVFTTCHHSKREWLKERFGLEDYQIGDSRSKAFVDTVLKGTNGKGVDCVINSLSGELQIESVKCLRERGSFCEIGKYDIIQNTPIGQALFERNISFHVIDLMPLLHDPSCSEMWDEYLKYGFETKEIKALPFIEYHQKDSIQAFRDMSQAKHKGKIVVRFDEWCVFENTYNTFNVIGQHHLITGGLGGLALCLAVRLSERGVHKLTLLSRSGKPKTQWQKNRINEITSNGTQVEFLAADVSNVEFESDVSFDLIWHSATVYDDVLYKDMTSEKWNSVQKVKVHGYNHLRNLFPNTHIVNFSSIVSYLGNPGQTNYAWANGELDHASYNDYNTTAIQFGAVDNVGFIGKDDKNLKILQNAAALSLVRINEMIDFIEEYALEGKAPVYSYYGLAQKKKLVKDLTKWTEADTGHLLTQVLGGTVDSLLQSSDVVLDELGLDSLSRVELANIVNELSVEIPPTQIGQMTLVTLTKKIKKI
jgi:fatty acid synthase